MRTFNVFVSHDASDGVWFVETSDIPGLNAEAPSYEQLVEIVLDLAPELVDVNLDDDGYGMPNIPVCVQHSVVAKRIHTN